MDYHKHTYAMIEMRVLYFLIMEATHKLTRWWTEQGLNLLFTYCLKAFRFWVENPKK